MRAVVADELLRVKAAYGDRRRTQIVNLEEWQGAKSLTATDLMPEQTVWIGVTADGLVSRTHDDKQPKHSGNDAPRWLVQGIDQLTRSTSWRNRAKPPRSPCTSCQRRRSSSHGTLFHRVSPLTEDDTLAAVFALPSENRLCPKRPVSSPPPLRHDQEESDHANCPGPSRRRSCSPKSTKATVLIGSV